MKEGLMNSFKNINMKIMQADMLDSGRAARIGFLRALENSTH